MGPSFASIRADEIRVGAVIVADTRTGEPFEPARSWSEVTATEKVVTTELVTSADGSPLVKVAAVRTTDGDPHRRVIRFFLADQIVQEVL